MTKGNVKPSEFPLLPDADSFRMNRLEGQMPTLVTTPLCPHQGLQASPPSSARSPWKMKVSARRSRDRTGIQVAS
jgi:hypothetical protein